jgi:uncharacterized protein (TIGR02001 family)
MRKLTTFTALALLMAGSAAAMADGLPSLKDTPVAPPASPWDVAFGGGVASEYVFRGISQSDRWPSVNAYTELRYNVNPSLQLYTSIGGYSISFPNDAAAEVDFNFGFRPTFDKLTLDFGGQYYWYPGGRLYNGSTAGSCTNGFYTPTNLCNTLEADLSFWEAYAKASYAFTDTFTLGSGAFYDPSWLNTGADGLYANVTAKYVLPGGWLPSADYGAFISGEFGHYWFGQTKSFYGNSNFPDGVDLPEYNTWNVGLSFTYKVFTLDFRYYDTDLSNSQCNVLTADQTARFSASNITSINPSGLGSNWCGEAFVAKLSFDMTASANLK